MSAKNNLNAAIGHYEAYFANASPHQKPDTILEHGDRSNLRLVRHHVHSKSLTFDLSQCGARVSELSIMSSPKFAMFSIRYADRPIPLAIILTDENKDGPYISKIQTRSDKFDRGALTSKAMAAFLNHLDAPTHPDVARQLRNEFDLIRDPETGAWGSVEPIWMVKATIQRECLSTSPPLRESVDILIPAQHIFVDPPRFADGRDGDAEAQEIYLRAAMQVFEASPHYDRLRAPLRGFTEWAPGGKPEIVKIVDDELEFDEAPAASFDGPSP